MKSKSDCIYRNAGDLDGAFYRLDSDETVLVENKALARKFVATWLAKGVTKTRGVKLVYSLRKLAQNLNKPFDQASKDDLIALVGHLENGALAESTKYDLKAVLKTFYRWLKGNDETMPPEIAWLKPRMKNRRHKLPEDILTDNEVLAMAQASQNARDKALVLVLYESGCRIGELLTLKTKHVAFDQYGAILRVTGKTGDRRVRIISSAPALSAWLEFYEGSKNPEAYLWPPRANANKSTDRPMVHASATKTIQNIAQAAGIKKHVHPHLFRHSRATALASKLTEAQMKEFFGWTQSSNMASIYVHLSGRDVDNALLALRGEALVQVKAEELQIAYCRRCHEKNSPSAKFCSRCGMPFDSTFIFQDQPPATNPLMRELMDDPEVKELMTKKAIERGIMDWMVF